MVYINSKGQRAEYTQSEDISCAVGCCLDNNGRLSNFSEEIAQHGGILAKVDAKERKVALRALSYAKRRRERNIVALQRQIANLDVAIENLTGALRG